jgi:hypothetical protein
VPDGEDRGNGLEDLAAGVSRQVSPLRERCGNRAHIIVADGRSVSRRGFERVPERGDLGIDRGDPPILLGTGNVAVDERVERSLTARPRRVELLEKRTGITNRK